MKAFIAILMYATCFLILFACQGPAGPQGTQGERGLPGLDAESPVIEFVDPCPQLLATHPEVLLFTGGKYYAVYAQGQKIHLSLLNDGVDYSTTDGRACTFRIIDGQVVQP